MRSAAGVNIGDMVSFVLCSTRPGTVHPHHKCCRDFAKGKRRQLCLQCAVTGSPARAPSLYQRRQDHPNTRATHTENRRPRPWEASPDGLSAPRPSSANMPEVWEQIRQQEPVALLQQIHASLPIRWQAQSYQEPLRLLPSHARDLWPREGACVPRQGGIRGPRSLSRHGAEETVARHRFLANQTRQGHQIPQNRNPNIPTPTSTSFGSRRSSSWKTKWPSGSGSPMPLATRSIFRSKCERSLSEAARGQDLHQSGRI